MKDKNLFKRLSALGFPLFETEAVQDANAALTDMAKSEDLRLWEGFPVVLANTAEKNLFDYDTAKRLLAKVSDKHNFDLLMVMSLALYEALNLKFSWAAALYKSFSVDKKKEFENFLEKLNKDEDFEVANRLMSGKRLKSAFTNYFNQPQARLNDLLSVKDELGLEYSLSQVFSPKQKELFLKRLKGEKLTKTEKEYFSRAVKKKVLALANPELHRLSQKVLSS